MLFILFWCGLVQKGNRVTLNVAFMLLLPLRVQVCGYPFKAINQLFSPM